MSMSMNIDSFWNGGAKAFLLRCWVTCLLGIAASSAFAQADTIPMVSFYSPSRGDYLTTSDPRWTCRLDGCADTEGIWGDYVVHAMEGHVYNPERRPRSFSIRALFQWYGALRGDHKLTSSSNWDPALVGTVKVDGGVTYQFVRHEGWTEEVGMPPNRLYSYWGRSRSDYATLASVKRYADSSRTYRVGLPEGYADLEEGYEGNLLPPPSDALSRCNENPRYGRTPPQYSDASQWTARANYVERWAQPMDFLGGDAIYVTGAYEGEYRIDFWGAKRPVVGERERADSTFPAPGLPRFGVMARVTSGRIMVTGQGWFEANQWFSFGGYGPYRPYCWLYDTRLMLPGELEFSFNDPNLSDNGGGTWLHISQWWD